MILYLTRVFIFTLLPLLSAAIICATNHRFEASSDKFEVYLIYLFGLGVAGSGIGSFIGHLFLSDIVAASVGWQAGSPFQLEMGFANLALGILGLIATSRQDGFREATVVAVTIVGVGATVVHIIDILQTGNLAPGNTWQNVANLARPALLIGLLRASRRAEANMGIIASGSWRTPHLAAVGWLTGMVSTGFAAGFASGRPVIGAALGVIAGAIAVWLILKRSQSASPA